MQKIEIVTFTDNGEVEAVDQWEIPDDATVIEKITIMWQQWADRDSSRLEFHLMPEGEVIARFDQQGNVIQFITVIC